MTLKIIPNWINGCDALPLGGKYLDKFDPHTGTLQSRLADSSSDDVKFAISAAKASYPKWSKLSPVKRGQVLSAIANELKNNQKKLAECIGVETGKPPQDAEGEMRASILQAEFFAGEGMRLYGRTLTSFLEGKSTNLIRVPCGVVASIVPANTPMANICWKIFPALICGNTVVLKASEDAPELALIFANLTKAAGLPDGVLNVVQGSGAVAGEALVRSEDVNVISFTGSSFVGKRIAEISSSRLIKVSLELGGKNSFIVCNDADIEGAAQWAMLSAFSNAGQRCAAASRIIVFNEVYEAFKKKLIEKTSQLKLGVDGDCQVGPVINLKQYLRIQEMINRAENDGGVTIFGAKQKPIEEHLSGGYYIRPTIIEGLDVFAELSQEEIFGPVTSLYRVSGVQEALKIANASKYGLTAAVHTRSINFAAQLSQNIQAGVVNINLGTYGSEPHVPFGGIRESGNGTREPGLESLDIYSQIKVISTFADWS